MILARFSRSDSACLAIARCMQLTEAAATLHQQPMAPHLRYLQTLTDIAAEKNSTIIFPLPIDWMSALLGLHEK
jgi:hypothetical protein